MATPLFPKRVDINNVSVQELQQLFTDTTTDLQTYLFTLDGKTVSRGNITQVRALIRQRLAKLGIDVGKWVSTAVPQNYVQGMTDAAKQHASFGNVAAAATIIALISHTAKAADIPEPEVVTSAPKVISPEQKLFELHTQSVQATMDAMSNSFAASMSAMGRSADQTINDVQRLDIRRQIAEQASEQADTSKISKQISETIRNNGISALTDAGGKQWSPEGYANMLVNTKLSEARNNGMMNSQTSVGEDLVEVDSHGATDSCADWEGEILSISGSNPNFRSVDDAYSSGDHIFGPNCEHGMNAVNGADFPSS